MPTWASAGVTSRMSSAKIETRFMTSPFSDLSNGVVYGDELGAVGEGRFHLDVVDHLGDAIHALRARDDMGAIAHQLGHGTAVARAFQDEIGNKRHRFRMVELDAALEPAAGHHGGARDQHLVFFPGRQIHFFLTRILLELYPRHLRAAGSSAASSSTIRK